MLTFLIRPPKIAFFKWNNDFALFPTKLLYVHSSESKFTVKLL